MKKVVHTPEGVRDIYGNECQRKHYLQNRIHDNFRCFGYQDIETPTFEFLMFLARRPVQRPAGNCTSFLIKKAIRWF